MNVSAWWNKSGWIFRWIFFLSSAFLIYHHLRAESAEAGFNFYVACFFNSKIDWQWLIPTLLLASLNWVIEAVKWRLLMRKVELVSLRTSLIAFFNGTAVSLFTPNRSGEFAGRILYLKNQNRIRGTLITLVGSTAQLLVTIQAGLVALLFLRTSSNPETVQSMVAFGILIIPVLMAITWAWLRMPVWAGFLKKIKIFEKWKGDLTVWDEVGIHALGMAWLLSFCRYSVFITQQFCIFQLMSYPIAFHSVVIYTAVSFLIVAIIPSIALGELGIRGGVAVALYGLAAVPASVVLAATFSLWIINVAQPAVFGSFAVLFLRRFKFSSSGQ